MESEDLQSLSWYTPLEEYYRSPPVSEALLAGTQFNKCPWKLECQTDKLTFNPGNLQGQPQLLLPFSSSYKEALSELEQLRYESYRPLYFSPLSLLVPSSRTFQQVPLLEYRTFARPHLDNEQYRFLVSDIPPYWGALARKHLNRLGVEDYQLEVLLEELVSFSPIEYNKFDQAFISFFRSLNLDGQLLKHLPSPTESTPSSSLVLCWSPTLYLKPLAPKLPEKPLEQSKGAANNLFQNSFLEGVPPAVTPPTVKFKQSLLVENPYPLSPSQKHFVHNFLEECPNAALCGPQRSGKKQTLATLILKLLATGNRILLIVPEENPQLPISNRIPKQLLPLALELNQLDNNKQLIVQRLQEYLEHTQKFSAHDFERYAKKSKARLEQVQNELQDLQAQFETQYLDLDHTVVFQGKEYSVRELLDEYNSQKHTNPRWMVGPVTPSSSLPLNYSEFSELFSLLEDYPPQLDSELEQALPNIEQLPSVDRIRQLNQQDSVILKLPIEMQPYWSDESDNKDALQISDTIDNLLKQGEQLSTEQIRYINALLHKNLDWNTILDGLQSLLQTYDDISDQLSGHEIINQSNYSEDEQKELLGELSSLFHQGKSLGLFSKLFNSKLSKFHRDVSIDGGPIENQHHTHLVELEFSRKNCKNSFEQLWNEYIRPLGLAPEINDWSEYQEELGRLKQAASWKAQHITPFFELSREVGLRLGEVTKSFTQGKKPTLQELLIALENYQELWNESSGNPGRQVKDSDYIRALSHLSRMNQKEHSDIITRLLHALQELNVESYERSLEWLNNLQELQLFQRQRERLLDKLAVDAPAWVERLRQTAPQHARLPSKAELQSGWNRFSLESYAQSLLSLEALDIISKIATLTEKKENYSRQLITVNTWAQHYRNVSEVREKTLTLFQELTNSKAQAWDPWLKTAIQKFPLMTATPEILSRYQHSGLGSWDTVVFVDANQLHFGEFLWSALAPSSLIITDSIQSKSKPIKPHGFQYLAVLDKLEKVNPVLPNFPLHGWLGEQLSISETGFASFDFTQNPIISTITSQLLNNTIQNSGILPKLESLRPLEHFSLRPWLSLEIEGSSNDNIVRSLISFLNFLDTEKRYQDKSVSFWLPQKNSLSYVADKLFRASQSLAPELKKRVSVVNPNQPGAPTTQVSVFYLTKDILNEYSAEQLQEQLIQTLQSCEEQLVLFLQKELYTHPDPEHYWLTKLLGLVDDLIIPKPESYLDKYETLNTILHEQNFLVHSPYQLAELEFDIKATKPFIQSLLYICYNHQDVSSKALQKLIATKRCGWQVLIAGGLQLQLGEQTIQERLGAKFMQIAREYERQSSHQAQNQDSVTEKLNKHLEEITTGPRTLWSEYLTIKQSLLQRSPQKLSGLAALKGKL